MERRLWRALRSFPKRRRYARYPPFAPVRCDTDECMLRAEFPSSGRSGTAAISIDALSVRFFVLCNMDSNEKRRQVIDLTAYSWLRGSAANVITPSFQHGCDFRSHPGCRLSLPCGDILVRRGQRKSLRLCPAVSDGCDAGRAPIPHSLANRRERGLLLWTLNRPL